MSPPKRKKHKSIGHAATRYFEIFEERRRYPRIIINRPIEVHTVDGGVVHTVAHNISADGLQLMSDRVSAAALHPSGKFIQSGQGPNIEIKLGLPVANQIQYFEAFCQITYIAVVPDVGIAFGVAFKAIKGKGQELLEAFMEESLEPPPLRK